MVATRDSVMLWKSDFKDEKVWNTICDIFKKPEDTVELELKVSKVYAFSTVRR
jgi:hypothetical protein